MGKITELLQSILNPSYLVYRAAGGKPADQHQQAVGYGWGDFFADFFTGGTVSMAKAAQGQNPLDDGSSKQQGPVFTPVDYTQSSAYQAAQAALTRAQAQQAAAQARTSYQPIQVQVPSFALPSTSWMTPPSTSVSGDLCGFSGSRKGATMDKYTVMGALKKASSMRDAKRGKVPVRTASTSKRQSPHKIALAKAGDSVKIALAAGNHAVARAAQYNPAKHQPLVDLKHAVVGGVLGLAPTKPLTPAQKSAVQKHVNAIAKHARAATWAKKQGGKAIDAAHALDAAKKKAGPKIAKLLANPKTRILGIVGAHILGLDIDAEPTVAETPDEAPVLGIYDEILGTVLGVDANGLSPGMPGYDPSTDPDAQGATQGAVSNYDPSTDPNVTALGPIPPTRGQPLSQSDAQVVWRKVPDDGVVYQGDRGFPDQSIGSWNKFYGPSGATDGYEWHATDNSWWVRRGADNFDHSNPTQPNFGSDLGWGPLIGNPNGQLAGLQWATDDQKWFWQAANAPAWATTDQDNALLELANKIAAADKAAADADAARIAQEQAQQQEAQAAQDAANALAQSAADTQSQIAQQQQAAQQAQLDIQDQQAQQQEAAQAAQQQAQSQAQYLEAQQVQLDYAKQHPEEFFGPNAPDQGGGDGGVPDYGDTGGGGPSGEGGAAFGPSPDDPFAGVPYMWEGDGSNE